MTFLIDLLNLLAENKKFPAYQAERRIDIFINFFLVDILKHEIGKRQKDFQVAFIAPEFPLKKQGNNQSTNVDYLCVLEDKLGNKKILFVELKTDSSSFDEDQLKTYIKFRDEKTWRNCIEELRDIFLSKGMPFEKRKKYYNLVKVISCFKISTRKKLMKMSILRSAW